MASLGDGSCGTLVDACTAVDAFVGIDDCNIVDGDCILGADICACTACHTIVSDYIYHFGTLNGRLTRRI